MLVQAIKIGAAAAGQHDLVGFDRLRQAPHDNLLGHQRRDLDANIEHLPGETRLHAGKHRLEPRAGKASGEEEDAFGHLYCC